MRVDQIDAVVADLFEGQITPLPVVLVPLYGKMAVFVSDSVQTGPRSEANFAFVELSKANVRLAPERGLQPEILGTIYLLDESDLQVS